VVVDEAQELSPMAWRALVRRVPTRSLTIVGDVAQTSSAAGARSWAGALDPVLRDGWRLEELTVSYRTPAEVADAAQRMAAAAGLPVSRLTAARQVDDALELVRATPSGPTAPVLEQQVLEQVVALAGEFVGPDGAGRVVEPAAVAEGPGGFSDLYVAMTRPTQRLVVVHERALPEGFGERAVA
jgi:hypothetical protein